MVSPSADLVYLTGYNALNFERPTLLILPQRDDPFFVVPQLEADKAHSASPDIEVRAWGDAEDPWAMVRAGIRQDARTIAVSDDMRASFVLTMQRTLPGTQLEAAGSLMASLRQYKEPGEIALLREAAHRTDVVFDRLRNETLANLTEIDVADLIGRHLKAVGLMWKWNYVCSVASGENSSSAHHTLSTRTIRVGDAVCMDFGGKYGEYPSDLTRTVCVGSPTRELAEVYAVVQDAQEQAVRAVRPGVLAGEVDWVARDVITRAGYGAYFVHRTGHGLGLEIHEHPYIVAGSREALAGGMVFSVEPGIYLPGQFGVRIEDTVVVTPDGCERLNLSTHDLCVVR